MFCLGFEPISMQMRVPRPDFAATLPHVIFPEPGPAK